MQNPIHTFKEERAAYFRDGMQDIVKDNLRMLSEASLITTILTTFFILLTPFIIKGWIPTPQHLLMVPSSALFCLSASWYQCKGRKSNIIISLLCLGFIACLLGFVISIDALQTSDQPGSFMPVMLVVIPSLFVFPFQLIYLEMFIFEIIYVVLVIWHKNTIMAQDDCFNSVVGIVISVFVAYLIQRLRAEAYNSKSQYKQRSMVDGLTGTLNKTNFEYLAKSYVEHCGESESYALLIMDVDDFKKVNDSMGHKAGDDVLEAIGEMLARTFYSTDIMGRFGGDEFTVLMRNISNRENVKEKCELFFYNLREFSERLDFNLSCSVGGVVSKGGCAEYEKIFGIADNILYRAKAEGKARYRIEYLN